MCDICDGASYEDVEARTDQCIRDFGRQILFVEPDRFSQSHAYTIGLSKTGHPEFLVRGLDFEDSMQLLNGLAASVLDHHEVFAHGHTARWEDGVFLYFSKLTSRIRDEAPWAYRRYGASMGLLEVLFIGRDLPYGCLGARNN